MLEFILERQKLYLYAKKIWTYLNAYLLQQSLAYSFFNKLVIPLRPHWVFVALLDLFVFLIFSYFLNRIITSDLDEESAEYRIDRIIVLLVFSLGIWFLAYSNITLFSLYLYLLFISLIDYLQHQSIKTKYVVYTLIGLESVIGIIIFFHALQII